MESSYASDKHKEGLTMIGGILKWFCNSKSGIENHFYTVLKFCGRHMSLLVKLPS
jgi:hypothetical protein